MNVTMAEWSRSPFARIHKRHQHLLDGAGERQTDLQRFGGQQRIAQVLLMQANAEAGLEIAADHHGRLGVQNRAAGKSALDGVEDHLGIEPGARGQHQRFAHGRDVASHHDLVGQLGYVARAYRLRSA